MTTSQEKYQKLRWEYRFDNFKRAYFLLQDSITQKQKQGLSQLEKEGVIQRFEYSIELAWKTMKDYLESQNVVFDQVTPRSIIREAMTAKIINQGDIWMDALDDRNKMSHTYDLQQFEAVITSIEHSYLPCLKQLYETLTKFEKSKHGL